MNILYISADPKINPDGLYGKARHIQGTIKELKRQGHSVVLVSNYKRKAASSKFEQITRLALGPLFSLKIFLKYRGQKFNFIYERYYLNHFTGFLLAKIWKAPFFLEFNYSFVYGLEREKNLFIRWLGLFCEKQILRSAAKIFTVSQVLKEYLLELGIACEKIIIAPAGVDVDFFNPDRPGQNFRTKLKLDDKIAVGFIGSFQEYHGLALILQTIAYLKEENKIKNFHFLLVGKGGRLESLQKQAREKEISEFITFLGEFSHQDMPSVLQAFDICFMVIPEYEDKFFKEFHGLPIKLLEYMAMGKPVIAPRVRTISNYLIKDNENGVLVRPGDFKDVAQNLIRLAADNDLRRALGRNARETILKNFTWQKKIEKIITVYEQYSKQ